MIHGKLFLKDYIIKMAFLTDIFPSYLWRCKKLTIDCFDSILKIILRLTKCSSFKFSYSLFNYIHTWGLISFKNLVNLINSRHAKNILFLNKYLYYYLIKISVITRLNAGASAFPGTIVSVLFSKIKKTFYSKTPYIFNFLSYILHMCLPGCTRI